MQELTSARASHDYALTILLAASLGMGTRMVDSLRKWFGRKQDQPMTAKDEVAGLETALRHQLNRFYTISREDREKIFERSLSAPFYVSAGDEVRAGFLRQLSHLWEEMDKKFWGSPDNSALGYLARLFQIPELTAKEVAAICHFVEALMDHPDQKFFQIPVYRPLVLIRELLEKHSLNLVSLQDFLNAFADLVKAMHMVSFNARPREYFFLGRNSEDIPSLVGYEAFEGMEDAEKIGWLEILRQWVEKSGDEETLSEVLRVLNGLAARMTRRWDSDKWRYYRFQKEIIPILDRYSSQLEGEDLLAKLQELNKELTENKTVEGDYGLAYSVQRGAGSENTLEQKGTLSAERYPLTSSAQSLGAADSARKTFQEEFPDADRELSGIFERILVNIEKYSGALVSRNYSGLAALLSSTGFRFIDGKRLNLSPTGNQKRLLEIFAFTESKVPAEDRSYGFFDLTELLRAQFYMSTQELEKLFEIIHQVIQYSLPANSIYSHLETLLTASYFRNFVYWNRAEFLGLAALLPEHAQDHFIDVFTLLAQTLQTRSLQTAAPTDTSDWFSLFHFLILKSGTPEILESLFKAILSILEWLDPFAREEPQLPEDLSQEIRRSIFDRTQQMEGEELLGSIRRLGVALENQETEGLSDDYGLAYSVQRGAGRRFCYWVLCFYSCYITYSSQRNKESVLRSKKRNKINKICAVCIWNCIRLCSFRIPIC
jgi:hypothetical protein